MTEKMTDEKLANILAEAAKGRTLIELGTGQVLPKNSGNGSSTYTPLPRP